MHIGFVSFPGHGHVNPSLPLVAELVRRGHRVSYAIQEQFVPAVEAAGATAIEVPGPRIPGSGSLDLATVADRLQTLMIKMLDAFDPIVAAWTADPVDVICYDQMAVLAPMIIEKLRVPGVAFSPSYAANEKFAPRQRMLQAISSGGGDAKNLERMREAMASLSARTAEFAESRGVSAPAFFDNKAAALTIVFIPKAFQPEADSFDDRYVFVGPDLGSRADEQWSPREPERPLLFISLGTAFNKRPDFFRACIAAFADEPWQVAMAIGEATTVEELGPVPDNFEIRSYFPQPAVLKQATVFVSHTGMNSTMESLYSGVPIVAVPQMPEQAMNAQQVVDLGLGRRLDPDAITPDLLRTTVAEVAADAAIRERVRAFSEELRAGGGAAAAADAIERRIPALV